MTFHRSFFVTGGTTFFLAVVLSLPAGMMLSTAPLGVGVARAQGITQETAATISGNADLQKVKGEDTSPAEISPCSDSGLVCKFFSGTLIALQSIFGWFLFVAGTALNFSAYVSIVQMGSLVNSTGGLAIAWSIFRDVGNLVLVFGFIAIGIATILDMEQYNAKKMLVLLLLVAVGINFSSLITRAVVDTGNIVALQFYKKMNCDGNGTNCKIPTGKIDDAGISNQFMKYTKISNLFSREGFQGLNEDQKKDIGDNFVYIGLLSIILYVVAIFVFIFMAIIFIARFVMLTFLITISPLAFAAMVIPRFQGQAKKWWDTLINQTLVAPLLILLLLVSLKILQDPRFLALGEGKWGDLQAPGWASLMVSFGIVCGFFIASIILAKSLSAFGAGFATKMAGRATRMTALPFRVASILPTRAAQAGASWANKKYDIGLASGFGMGKFGKGLAKVARVTALDDAIKGGFGAVQKVKPGGFMSREERKKFDEHREHELHGAKAEATMNQELRDIAGGKIGSNGQPITELSTPSKQFLNNMSAKGLAELKAIKEENEAVVRALSQKTFDKLIDSDADIDRGRLQKARDTMYNETNIAVTIKDMSGNEVLEKLPKTVWSDTSANGVKARTKLLTSLTSQKLVQMDPDKMSAEQRNAIREYFNDGVLVPGKPVGPGHAGAVHAEFNRRRASNPKIGEKWKGELP